MLRDQLRRRTDSILERWYEDVLASYSVQAAAVWRRERDRFVNPVGHALRDGMRAMLAAVLDAGTEPEVRASLGEILRIRAVQQLSAAEAVGFVLRLRGILRAELGDAAPDPAALAELAELEARIDAIALAAFDVYTEQRERFFAVRINELKKNIPWVVTRAQRAAAEREQA